MKLIDKQVVEATDPRIYIGRRTYRHMPTGQIRVARPYWAEYFTDGRQHQESLRTGNKAAAMRAAYALAERLDRGQQRVKDSRRTIEDLTNSYNGYCAGRGRAKKTLVKYKGQLARSLPGANRKALNGHGHSVRMICLPIARIWLMNAIYRQKASTVRRFS